MITVSAVVVDIFRPLLRAKRTIGDVGSKDCSHIPFHLWLALPDAKSTGSDWYAQNRCGFVAAAPLQVVRVSKLIDINPRVKRLYRNNQVHVLKAARKLTAQIN